jgi:uncharacterized protein with NRDE domain
MCLILVAWQQIEGYPLVVAANRDEYHVRPAAAAAFWQERPDILAGRDLQAMGTWMGVSRFGKFCAVTNFRGARESSAAESRGALVTRYLENSAAPGAYMAELAERAGRYSGFNLLASDARELWWMSNRQSERGTEPRRLAPGIYGLGNDLLDSDDVAAAKRRFQEALPAVEPLFSVLGASKIIGPQYGTRCSSVLLCGAGGRLHFAERSFSAEGSERETVRFELDAAR